MTTVLAILCAFMAGGSLGFVACACFVAGAEADQGRVDHV